MLRREALRILALPDAHSEADLRAAYVEAVRLSHPDTGRAASSGVTWSMEQIMKARDTLGQRFEPDTLPECERCKGKGVILGLSKFGTTCKTCQGTGRETRS